MNDPHKVTYQFAVDPEVDLSGLRVNLHISGKSTGSSWYDYSKTMTMIDGGKVLAHQFKDDDNLFYTIEAVDTKRGYSFEYSDPYEHDSLRTDYIRSFIFSDQVVKLGTQIIGNRYESSHFYEKQLDYRRDDTKTTLAFYDPKKTKYQMSELSAEYVSEITTKTDFEYLKKSTKLKEEDILRLNLTDEQKQELIKIHSQLEFEKP